MNGILPNLDLVNVMVYLCRLEDIPTAFHLQVQVQVLPSFEQHSSCSLLTISLLPQWETLRGLTANDRHLYSLWTVLSLAAHQAPGLPLTNHALFLKHRIDSLTVRGVANPITTHDHRSLHKLARQDTLKLYHFLALFSHRWQPHIRLIPPYHTWQLLLAVTESWMDGYPGDLSVAYVCAMCFRFIMVCVCVVQGSGGCVPQREQPVREATPL